MNIKLKLASLAGLLLCQAAQAQNEIPAPDEYAYRFPLHVEQGADFIAADIPLEVYRSVVDPSLRDVGVYNAAGQAVPRKLEAPREPTDRVERATPLGMVPLYGPREGELADSGRRLQLLMQLDEPGATLQFQSDRPESSDPELQLHAVIVDMRGHESVVSDLQFTSSGAPNGFIGTVTVEQGNDLADWKHLARGTLAQLEYENTLIEQNRIAINTETADFLRISWRGMPRAWRPQSVTAIATERAAETDRTWLSLQPTGRDDDGRTFTFDIGGYPPIDRIELELPGNNAVVRAALEVRHGAQTGWSLAHQGLFYRITQDGNEIQSRPAAVSPARAAQWRVRLLSGQIDGDLRLRVGWKPDRLVFLTQGEGPYTLATGRSRDRLENFPQQRLLGDSALFSMLERSGAAGRASVGGRMTGAGSEAMKSPRAWTWRTVLVWIGLLAAVGFVGYLVLSLMREGDGSSS